VICLCRWLLVSVLLIAQGCADDTNPDAGAPDAADTSTMDTGVADALRDTPRDSRLPDTGHFDSAVGDAGANVLVPGYVCGDYLLVGVSVRGAPPGEYTMTAPGPMGSIASLSSRGMTVATISYPWDTTVGPVGSGTEYVFRFPGYLDVVVAHAGSGSGDLSEIGGCLFDGARVWRVGGGMPYVVGERYGGFVLLDITNVDPPPGEYTFLADGDQGTRVDAIRGGTIVGSAAYTWTTTIGAEGSGLEQTFVFPGLFEIVIAKEGMGTRNLYQVNVDVFDGLKTWTVP